MVALIFPGIAVVIFRAAPLSSWRSSLFYFGLRFPGHNLAKITEAGYKPNLREPPALRPYTMKYRTLVYMNSTGVLMEAPHSDLEANFLAKLPISVLIYAPYGFWYGFRRGREASVRDHLT
jgi:hypothetical protein